MRTVRWLDLAAKAALVLLIGSALLFPDLSGIKEKASTARLVVYPLGALVIPAWWFLYGRRRVGRPGVPQRFPWAADLLITLPWLLDMLGNRFNLFDTVTWWDDMMHFVNWALLTAGALLAWGPAAAATRAMVVMCGLGFGVSAAVAWELGEYAAFIRNSPELTTAYTDTLGDLALGSLGALLAGITVAVRRRPASPRTDTPSSNDPVPAVRG